MRTRADLSGSVRLRLSTVMSGKLRLTAPWTCSRSYFSRLRASRTIVPGSRLRRMMLALLALDGISAPRYYCGHDPQLPRQGDGARLSPGAADKTESRRAARRPAKVAPPGRRRDVGGLGHLAGEPAGETRRGPRGP